jgi:hypothetical protein
MHGIVTGKDSGNHLGGMIHENEHEISHNYGSNSFVFVDGHRNKSYRI